MRRFLLLGLASALSVPAIGLVRRHDVADSVYIGNAIGLPLARIQYATDVSGTDLRSGILINDQWVLTAAHNNSAAGTTITINGQAYSRVSWTSHPSFSGSALLNGFDLSLLKLDRRVLDVAPGFVSALAPVGQQVSIAGLGLSNNGLGTTPGPQGTWRAGTQILELDPAFPNIYLTDFDRPEGTVNPLADLGSSNVPTVHEACVAPGDSGGPVFQMVGGRPGVVAVISATTNSAAPYGTINVFSAVQPALPWIASTVEPRRVEGLASVTGVVNPRRVELTIEVRARGGATPLETFSVPLAVNFGYSFRSGLTGARDLFIRGAGFLNRRVPVSISATTTTLLNLNLVSGDVDGNNEIGPGDFTAVLAVFGAELGEPGYVLAADADRNGEVGPGDFSVILMSFGAEGDN